MNNVFVHNPLLDSGGDIGADAYGFQPGAILKYENTRQKGGEWALSLGAFSSDVGANFSGSNRSTFVIGQAEMNTATREHVGRAITEGARLWRARRTGTRQLVGDLGRRCRRRDHQGAAVSRTEIERVVPHVAANDTVAM